MEEKLSLISELIYLAKADFKIDEAERAFINILAQGMGISESQVDHLIQNPTAFDPPTEPQERILQFQRLILLMNIDREITDNEIAHIKLAGIRLGLNPQATDEVLKRMYDYPNNMIPPADLITIFVKHYN